MKRTAFAIGLAVLAAASGLTPGLAGKAGDVIGKAVAIVPDVTGEVGGPARKIAAGTGVRFEELIATGEVGQAQIALRDDTKLAVGPGAKLKLDKFVYNADATNQEVAVSFLKGAFRFITGKSKKEAYKLKTSNASIGVRGTVFDAFIADDLGTLILLHEGALDGCNTLGECKGLDVPGLILWIHPDGSVEGPMRWRRSIGGGKPLEELFPFLNQELEVDPVIRRYADRPKKRPPGGEDSIFDGGMFESRGTDRPAPASGAAPSRGGGQTCGNCSD